MSQITTKPKKKHTVRNILLFIAAAIAFCAAIHGASQENNKKYLGHGFDYMNGYSSTDFTGYHVYDSEKLCQLDHPASLHIEHKEDFPVLDGAEACYPVYSALALAAYENIAQIEKDYHDQAEKYFKNRAFSDDQRDLLDVYLNNGKYVTFTNSSKAYYRLCDGIVDLLIGAAPSASQKEYAALCDEQIVTTPIGKEAFIFFTQADNPVDNLTSDEIRAIYHGDIKNWKEVGGKDQKIIPFQRPEESGSQVAMRWFMGDVPMADPKTVEFVNVGPMGGVVKEVAQYNDEAGALGYTFKYFLTGLNQEKNVKILSVDGVYPDTENIKNGKYPAVVSVVCATLASNESPYVKEMMEFVLSDDGQEIIEQTGYAPLSDRNVTPVIENTLELKENVFANEDGQFIVYSDPFSGDYLRFALKYGTTDVKGQIHPSYMDGVIQENRYYISDNDSQFETEAEFDPETNSFIFVKTEYNPKELQLPPDGTAFTRESEK